MSNSVHYHLLFDLSGKEQVVCIFHFLYLLKLIVNLQCISGVLSLDEQIDILSFKGNMYTRFGPSFYILLHL